MKSMPLGTILMSDFGPYVEVSPFLHMRNKNGQNTKYNTVDKISLSFRK